MIANTIRFKSFLTTKKGKTVISLILSVLITASMITVFAVASRPNEVTILDGTKSKVVSTSSQSPEEIITEEGFTLGKYDVLDASQFNKENSVLIIKRQMTIVYSDNSGESWNVTLPARTVADVVSYLGIKLGDDDVTMPSMFSVLSNGDRVSVYKAGKATISVDGKTITVNTSNKTVSAILNENGITLGKEDTVTPAAGEVLKNGENAVVSRITYSEETKSEEIKVKTVYENDASLTAGQTKVKSAGKSGLKDVTYKIKYKDGKEISRTVISQKTVEKAVDKVVLKGTKQSGAVKAASAGNLKYSQKFVGTASAYYEAPGSMTACGLTVGVGRVGVNPNIIPYGTRLYITGYGYAVAADTGYGVTGMGRLVDLYMNSESACEQWGLRTVTVYVLS